MSFIIDDDTLPGPKVTHDGVSTELAQPTMWCSAADYNALRTALFDTRSFVKTALTPGAFTNANCTVDADGRITAIASGSSGITDGDKGDIIIAGSGTSFTVDAGVVTNAKLANVATSTIKGRTTAGTGSPEDLTAAQARTVLGLSPVAASGSAADLSAGTLLAARMPALTGDVTTVAGAVATTIAASAVSNAKLANMAANSIKGNNTGGSAAALDLTAAQVRTLLGLAAIATSGSGADLVAASVANAALATMATNTVKANLTGGTATPTDVTVATLAASVGSTLTAGPGWFGDGSDGAVNFDGSSAVTGFTRSGLVYSPSARPSWYFTTLTIGAGVTICGEIGGEGTGGGASFEIWANVGTVVASGAAIIKINGATPTTNAAATVMTTGHTGATTGQGAGGIQNAGQNGGAFTGVWCNSRKAGAGGFGGASLTAAASTAGGTASTTLADSVGLPCTFEQAKIHRLNSAQPGAASGGGGGGSGAGTVGIASGGAGGNGGGVLTYGTRTYTGPGTLSVQVKGGNGAPGVSAVGSNAGGGSGGGGGEVTVAVGYSSLPAGITIDKSGGTGGAPQGAGSAGGSGVAGQQMVYSLGPG